MSREQILSLGVLAGIFFLSQVFGYALGLLLHYVVYVTFGG